MVNQTNARRLINALREPSPYVFDMRWYSSKATYQKDKPSVCTVCLAGFTVTLLDRFEKFAYGSTGERYDAKKRIVALHFRQAGEADQFEIFTHARKFLGLSEPEADWLFFGKFSVEDLDSITMQSAIYALEALISKVVVLNEENQDIVKLA